MQKIMNVSKWSHVEPGGAINFANEAQRRIRLDVNTAKRAALFYVTGDGETTLLASVLGRDVVEFATHGGPFSIVIEDADAWLHTVDDEDFSFVIPDAVSMTKLIERRERNPEIEMMAAMMRANSQRMLEQQQDELERVLSRREKAFEARLEKLTAARSDGGDTPKPAPAAADASAGGSGTADAGNGADGGDKRAK